MTTGEWLEQTLATRPPLTPAQIAILRPILTSPHMPAAPAPAIANGSEAARHIRTPVPERTINARA